MRTKLLISLYHLSWCVLMSCIVLSGSAQIASYSPLRSAGTIPDDFKQTHYPNLILENEVSTTKKNSSEISASDYHLHRILSSGNVTYGDSVSNYLSRIADQLLKTKPELRSKIRIYTLKSTQGNLISAPCGLILVPVQIVAQCENEAQLAYQLSVEIARIENNQFQNTTNDSKGGLTSYNLHIAKPSATDIFEKPFPYLTDLLSDSAGYRMYRAAGYESSAASNSMDVWQWSHLPFMDIAFKPDFFEFDTLQFPEYYLLKNAKPLPFESTYVKDVFFEDRRNLLSQLAITDKGPKGNSYLLGKAEFQEIKKMAQFETILCELAELKYSQAFYDAYSLLTKFPENSFAKESMCKALYGLTKYVNAEKKKSTDLDSENSYGNFERCAYFFEQLTPDQLTLFTIRFLFEEVEKHHNPFLQKLLEDLIGDALNTKDLDLELISAAQKSTPEQQSDMRPETTLIPNNTADLQDGLDEDSGAKNSKFARLRKEKKDILSDTTQKKDVAVIKTIVNLNIQQRAFGTIDLARFEPYYLSGYVVLKSKRKRTGQYIELRSDERPKKNVLNIDSLIFVNPSSYDFNRRGLLLPETTYKHSTALQQNVSLCADAAGIETSTTSNVYTDQNGEDDFNRNALLSELTHEILLHMDQGVEMQSLQGEYTLPELALSGMHYCCLATVTHSKEWRTARTYEGVVLSLPLYIVAPFLAPLAFTIGLTKLHLTCINMLIVDLQNSELVYSFDKEFKYKNSDGMVNSLIYGNLAHLNTSRNQ